MGAATACTALASATAPYTVTITDANGCTPVAVGTATINALAQPNQANAGADLVGCVGSFPIALNVSVVNATGGAWSGGSGSFTGAWPNVGYNPSVADLAAGGVTLRLTTIGNSNCPAASDQVYINLPNSFASLSISSTNATCYGSTTGTASVTPNDPSFTFQWNDPASQTTAHATALPAGTWGVVVTDAFGCATTLGTTITQPSAMVLLGLTATDETCAGFGNGSITSSVSGGTQPYSYAWSNGATSATISAGAGTYNVSITDANGCVPVSGTATINATGQPNAANAGPDLVGCLNSYPIALQAGSGRRDA